MEQLKNVRSVDNLVDDINEHFQNISHKIKRLSKKNNLAYNVFLENQFIPIYNIGFSLEFEKCKRPREPAIDLIDNTKKIGLQVSSEATIGKLKKTFKQFYKNGKDEEIVRLKFFFLVQDGNKLNQVCVNDIVEYLNSEKILVEINSIGIGSAPEFKRPTVVLASSIVKFPSMIACPPVMAVFTIGAWISCPSR